MNHVISKIRFSQEALKIFNSQINQFKLIETGGVLLGCVKGNIINVEKASDAGPNAIHEEFYFKADPNYIDMFIDMEYANSGEKIIYLGEWHTHQQFNPEPSLKDLISLSEIATSSTEFTILLIIGVMKFDLQKFLNQSISILKYNNIDKKIFILQAELESIS